MNLTAWAIAAVILIALITGSGTYGYLKGEDKANLACANATTSANAAAIALWQQQTAAQALADSARAEADQARTKAAADQLEATQAKWAAMKIAVVKNPPAAKCDLSPDYIRLFNGAPQ